MYTREQKQTGFTIIELLVVIVIIGVLASITIIAYRGITQQGHEAVLQSDLKNAQTTLEITRIDAGAYPNNGDGLKTSEGTTFTYSGGGTTYCLEATSEISGAATYHITQEGIITEGACPEPVAANGDLMQTITTDTCPTTRIRAVDARDNRTYWVQKLADDKCWMLTNLAYAGGGTNTYGDVKTLINGTSDYGPEYTTAKYYIPSGANVTTEPTNPSSSTSGTGQYGYFYNWCAAMGAQTSTSACANATTPAPNTGISVCPAGWRLPTGGGAGEFKALNDAINGGSSTNDSNLRTVWLAQYGGFWAYGFNLMGSTGYYWSSLQESATSSALMTVAASSVVTYSANNKGYAEAVRCVASS